MQHTSNMGQCCHQAPTHCRLADIRRGAASLPPGMQNEGLKHPSCRSIKQHQYRGAASALTRLQLRPLILRDRNAQRELQLLMECLLAAPIFYSCACTDMSSSSATAVCSDEAPVHGLHCH